MLDMGNGYGTRLSAVLAFVPPEHVSIDPPFPGKPTMYARLKHDLGVLPCYLPIEEVEDWLGEYALGMMWLGRHYFCDRTEIVAVLPPTHMEVALQDGEPPPTCFVQLLTGGLILPGYYPAEQVMSEVQRYAQGFFGE